MMRIYLGLILSCSLGYSNPGDEAVKRVLGPCKNYFETTAAGFETDLISALPVYGSNEAITLGSGLVLFPGFLVRDPMERRRSGVAPYLYDLNQNEMLDLDVKEIARSVYGPDTLVEEIHRFLLSSNLHSRQTSNLTEESPVPKDPYDRRPLPSFVEPNQSRSSHT